VELYLWSLICHYGVNKDNFACEESVLLRQNASSLSIELPKLQNNTMFSDSNIKVSSGCWTFTPLKLTPLRCLETSGTKYLVTQYYFQEELVTHNCCCNVERSCCHAFHKSSSNFFQHLEPRNRSDISISVTRVCLTIDLFESHFPLHWLSSEYIMALPLNFPSVLYIPVQYSHFLKLLPMLIHLCTSVLFNFIDVITSCYPVFLPYVTKKFSWYFLKGL